MAGETRDLGAVLVGTGMVAATHVAAIADAPGVRLAGVVSRRADRAEAFAAANGTVAFADVAAAAASPEVDIAIVVTPPNARAEVVGPFFQARKPVLLEKPVARTPEEAEALVGMAEAAGVPLGVVFQHRMRAASLAAARHVASGDLGPLVAVEVAVPWWRDQAYYDEPGRGSYARDGGGVLISQAIHTLDLMLSLTGPVAAVQALVATTRAHRMEAEDFVAAGLRFANGAVGSLMATTASFPGRAESIRLHHAAASLTLEAGVLQIDWRDGRSQTEGAAGGTGGGADPMAFTHDWHRAVLEDFCDAVRSGRPPAVPGRAALEVHRLIGALEASGRSGGMEAP